MAWLEPLVRRTQAAWALNWSGKYPEELPSPQLGPISPRQAARIQGLESVCLFLGPYRNLTSLTASVLFLHPECQVLNHAGGRILGKGELNFLLDYSKEKFKEFCHFALTMSQGGARGGYGGSIVLSHAFAEHEGMKKLFRARYGSQLLKRNVKSLVWKESEMVSRFIRKQGVDLTHLIAQNQRLKFLLPIRNPLDCSLSIHRIGVTKFYPELTEGDIQSVLVSILEEIKWFVDLYVQDPTHFLYFFQDGVDAKVLQGLAEFLGLSQDERWVKDSLSVYKLRGAYDYEPSLKDFYIRNVEEIFQRIPEVEEHLKRMVSVGV